MTKPHAIWTLEKKRTDLKADLAHLEMMLERTLTAIAHVEAALAIVRDAKKRGAPSGLQRRWLFRRGELKRLILAIEQDARGPLTHREVAQGIIARLNWCPGDIHLQAILRDKVKSSRRRLQKNFAVQNNRLKEFT